MMKPTQDLYRDAETKDRLAKEAAEARARDAEAEAKAKAKAEEEEDLFDDVPV
jgi:hypothetical protein